MKRTSLAILAACVLTFGGLAAEAQSWTNCSGNTANNDCLGWDVLSPNSGGYNAVFGNESMPSNSYGENNSALGFQALNGNTTGSYNTATGYEALYQNTGGWENTAVGALALGSVTTGEYNAAVGYEALEYNTGSYNTALGPFAAQSNSTGEDNIDIGPFAAESNTTGGDNIAIGAEAGYTNATGSSNIAIGFEAGYSNPTDANYNIDIGYEGNASDTGGVIRLGTSGQQTVFYAPAVYTPIMGGDPVYVLSNGQLGYEASSIRFKKDVRSMGAVSSAIYRLRPVTYRYKQPAPDGSQPIEYGLIAEDVARVYPDMVVRDANGQIQTVEYQKLTPMMLNELQKQHRLLEEQQAKIDQLEKQLGALPALEKRLTALEAAQPSSARLEARLATK